MTTQNSNPSLNPANNNTIAGMMNVLFNKLMQSIDGVLPAKVVAYKGYPANVAQVQPSINLLATNSQQTPRGQIAEVPVCQMGGGGSLLRFNLSPGDLGLILACDRDISLFKQFWSAAPPNTNRIKNFSDALFLPLVFTGVTVESEDIANATLQSLDGSIRISLFPDKIKMTGEIELKGNAALFDSGSFGGGEGVISIANATTPPASNPTGGGILYVLGGALHYRGSSGTDTIIAPP